MKIVFVNIVILFANICLGTASLATENWQIEGEHFYRQGNLDKAQTCFVNLLKLQPGNLVGHYYLGLISLRNKKNEQAVSEFQFIISTNSDGPVAQLSRQALDRLKSTKLPGDNSLSAMDRDSDRQSIKQAVSNIRSETDNSKQVALKEEAEAAAILKEADEKASALEAEAKQQELAMSKEVYYARESGYGNDGLYRSLVKEYPLYTANEIAAACEGLLLKANQIRGQAAKKVLDVSTQAKQKELATEKAHYWLNES